MQFHGLGKVALHPTVYKGRFPLGGIFRAELLELIRKDKEKFRSSLRKIPPSGKRPLCGQH
jgi:hypothetical protein